MKSKTKLIVSVISIAMVLVLCVTGVWLLTNRKTTSVPGGETVGGVIDDAGNDLVSGQEYEFGQNLTFLSASAASQTSPEGVTLTATIEPVNATYQNVDWTAKWKYSVNEGGTQHSGGSMRSVSGWGTGKDVADYVSVIPKSDGSSTATVKCLKEFGEEIIITVSSRKYPSIFASCTVDYMKRYVSSDLGIEGKTKISGTNNYLFEITDFEFNGGSAGNYNHGEKWLPQGSYTLGTGTKTPAIYEDYKFIVPQELRDKFGDSGYDAHNAYYDDSGCFYASSDPMGISWDGTENYAMFTGVEYVIGLLFGNGIGAEERWYRDEFRMLLENYYYYHSSLYNEETGEFSENIERVPLFEVQYELEVAGKLTTHKVGFHMPLSCIEIAVESIRLDKTEIIV